MTDILTDWRGTPIAPGATVIYGAGVGRSIELVEATVQPEPGNPDKAHQTANGDVWLTVTRRSYQKPSTDRVRAGADRLTVVAELAPTDLPTARQVILATAADDINRYIEHINEVKAETSRATHDSDGHLQWTADEEVAYYTKRIRDRGRTITRFSGEQP